MTVRTILFVIMLFLGASRAWGQAQPGDVRIDSRDVRVCLRAGCVAGGDALAGEIARAQAAESGLGSAAVPKAGGTMTGSLILSGMPTAPLQAAPMSYVDAEQTRATGAESVIAGSVSAEITRAQNAESLLASLTALNAETSRATAAEGANGTAIANEAAMARNASNLTSGTLATVRLSVGTASGTIAAGNDSRIVGAIQSSSLGQPSGPATLDANTKVSASTLVNRAAISPLTTSITNAPVGVYPPGNYVAISIMSPDQTITCRGDGTLPVINAAGYTAAPGYYLIWPAIGTVDTPTNVVRCVASGATTIVTTAR